MILKINVIIYSVVLMRAADMSNDFICEAAEGRRIWRLKTGHRLLNTKVSFQNYKLVNIFLYFQALLLEGNHRLKASRQTNMPKALKVHHLNYIFIEHEYP